MTRKLGTLLLALLMALSVIPALGLAEAGTPPLENAELVEIDWYVGQDPMPDAQVVNDALNEYLVEKINTKVNIHYWTGKEWEDKMPTMIASGQDLGIIGFGSQSKLDYVVQATRGAFYPLNDLLGQYGTGIKSLFSDEVWECMTIDGNIYGVPSLKDNCYIISLIYNEELATELGLDMENLKFGGWTDLNDFFYDAMEKRTAIHPEYDEPLVGDVPLESPYYFAVESFLNDSFLAVCNIDGIMDIEGYDPNTVFNLYASAEYRQMCIDKQKMVEAGIYADDYTDKTEWNYSGQRLASVGWGYAYMQDHLWGDNFTTKMVVSDRQWTDTNNYFSAGTAISANCAHPERAMQVLELANTDPYVATMLRFGVEGEHYVRDENGKMVFEGSKRNGGDRADYGYYYWYMAPVGNLLIVEAPESLTGPDSIMLKNIEEYNNNATIPSHMGFVLDMTPITNEIAACTNVVMEYRDMLRKGQLGSEDEVNEVVDEFIEKLNANGIETIITETQAQIDAWNAAKAAE